MISSAAHSRSGRVPSAAPDSRWLSAVVEHSQRRPDSAAVLVNAGDDAPATVLTYRELMRTSVKLSQVLAETIKPGQTVILAAEGGLEYVAWFCAALMAGLRLFPIHCHSTAAEVRSSAEQSGAVAIIMPDGLFAADAWPTQKFSLSLAGRSSAGANSPDCATILNGAILLQSSGTTGTPKLVLRETAALDAVALNVAQAFQLCPDDRLLAVVPLSHSYGVDLLLAALFSGASIHVMPKFDATVVSKHLAESVTVIPGVPFMFDALSRIPPTRRPLRLRLAVSAGTHLPLRIVDSFNASWGCTICQLYGATELGSVTFNHPALPDFNPASVGTPMGGVSIRILNPDDHAQRLATNESGHVAIAAPSMLTGYVNLRSTQDERHHLADGHFLTGDLGSLDQHGRLLITGRLKLLIDVGGLKVNPLEIEAVLSSHPEVAECVIVPLPLSDIVTRIRAVFVARTPSHPPATEELRAFLKQRLSAHKLPRVIDCVASLPKSSTGKIQRRLVSNP